MAATPPLTSAFAFLGPLEVRERTGVGGGRGVFATEDIPAGALVMREEPALTLTPTPGRGSGSGGEHPHVALARLALLNSDRKLDEAVAALHPRTLADFSPGALKKARERHGVSAKKISEDLAAAQKGNAKAGASPSDDQCLLVILKMQCNAFEGGLFIRMAMVNHSAAPNLHKFQPGGNVRGNNTTASEARAVKDIEKGEEVTWTYFSPLIELTPTYQTHLFLNQHYTLPLPSSTGRKREGKNGSASGSWPYPDETLEVLSTNQNPKKTDEEGKNAKVDYIPLENMLGALEQSMEEGKIDVDRVFQHLEANDTIPLLGKSHIIRARIYTILSRGCQKKIIELRGHNSGEDSSNKLGEYACWMMETLQELERIQKQYLPPTHIQFGATLGDAHATLTYLLASHRPLLFSRFSQTLGDFGAASLEEARLRETSGRIQKLYEEDSESLNNGETENVEVEEEVKATPANNDGKIGKELDDAWGLFD